MQSRKIEGFFHYGVAVQNLENVTDFFVNHLGLKVVASREIRADYIQELVGSNGVWAEVRMLELGTSGFLEILKWHEDKESPRSSQGSITSVGAQHLCLTVSDVDGIIEGITSLPDIEMISKGVTEVTEGPNRGARVAFLLVDKILFVELFQKP